MQRPDLARKQERGRTIGPVARHPARTARRFALNCGIV